MNVILLEKVQNLGGLGDQVSVKPGYGRNYLIPNGIAVAATKDNIEIFEAKRAELEKASAEKLAQAEKRKALIETTMVTIAHKAGDEGKLFGSVGTLEISRAATSAGAEIAKNEVKLSEGALRQTGEYEIQIQLYSDVMATLKLNVVAE